MIKDSPSMLLVVLGIGVITGVFASLVFSSETGLALLTILLSMALIVTLGTYAWRRAWENGVFDILVLFSLFFLAYNALIPIEVGLRYLLSHKTGLNYPLQFGIEQFTLTTFLSLLAGLMFMIGGQLSIRIPFKPRLLMIRINGKLSFSAGSMLFAFGVVLFVWDYSRIGGYFNALALDRVTRLNLLSELRGNLPYIQFILVGVMFMAYGSLTSCKSKLSVYAPVTAGLLFISVLMLGGDRRYSLYILLVLLSVYSSVRGPIRLNRRVALLGMCFYVLFAVVQNIRWMFPLLVRGALSLSAGYRLFADTVSYEFFLPGSTELAGPYLSLLYYGTSTPGLLEGKSYLYAVPYLLPRSLYPGTKVPTISQQFALQIHESFYPQSSGITGWGFNPVAEALANFGYVGPVIVFLFVGLVLGLATHLKNKDTVGSLVLAAISPLAFNLNRADFANTFQEVTYNVFLVIIVGVTLSIIHNASHKHARKCDHI